MIEEVKISNFKSITELTIPLGRVNVFIGANGSGKSNILEAMAIGSAAANNKLDNEFLVSRGIRVSDDPRFMRAAFDQKAVIGEIELSFTNHDSSHYSYKLNRDNSSPYSQWIQMESMANDKLRNNVELRTETSEILEELDELDRILAHTKLSHGVETMRDNLRSRMTTLVHGPIILQRFLIFSPENSALRTFEKEGQIQPLGIRGEGLLKLLRVMHSIDTAGLEEINQKLQLIDWFSDFEIDGNISSSEQNIRIRDRYLDADLAYFDQKSANEGFLFLLFYFALFISKETPPFFAIDNIDASLNPKLCSQLIIELTKLAQEKSKQVLLTTHNPAILDGLDLNDDQQRLFVVSRSRSGNTRIKRIAAPKVSAEHPPVRLSEAFLRGYLGGLPDNF